jgi:ribonucleoside-diphosphate reductase alpha chain
MPEIRSRSVKELRRQIEQLKEEVQTLTAELSRARRSPYRCRLELTRNSITHKFAIDQHEGYITVGLFDDGRPGELFVRMAKEGSTMGGLMDTVGILTSLALQYGVSVETLARKFEHVSFEPSGWTRNPAIHRTSSVVDYIFRWLGMQFCETYRQEQLAIRCPKTTSDDGIGLPTESNCILSVATTSHMVDTYKETHQ